MSFKSAQFPINWNTNNEEIRELLCHLANDLSPMDKQAMSGTCHLETCQMEKFLFDNFQFRNIPGEYIVQGVKSFHIEWPPKQNPPSNDTVMKFPNKDYDKPFEMTAEEISEWQKSYVAYAADDDDLSITKEFLKGALEGKSASGDEAFLMKFVVRISTCPILMEFDAKIIERKLEEDWPHRIKLVSVTGVDFAGRIHDVKDIQTYITNWKDVYEFDSSTNLPFVYGGRDFQARRRFTTELNVERLRRDLKRMARLRLSACDKAGVQIVVETGIGLGVFAGRQIGIDDQTRKLSAESVKDILEEDASTYSNIKAVVFAMPIFETDESTSTYHCFVEIFRDQYSGSIPVLIADQDMHRLAVAIAKKGFIVSELNPADSHGVFGEYWQNRGPAVEEKLALTTLGLLIQHHIFNKDNVLNVDNYEFISLKTLENKHKPITTPKTDCDNVDLQKPSQNESEQNVPVDNNEQNKRDQNM